MDAFKAEIMPPAFVVVAGRKITRSEDCNKKKVPNPNNNDGHPVYRMTRLTVKERVESTLLGSRHRSHITFLGNVSHTARLFLRRASIVRSVENRISFHPSIDTSPPPSITHPTEAMLSGARAEAERNFITQRI